jgi:hypothetical protein
VHPDAMHLMLTINKVSLSPSMSMEHGATARATDHGKYCVAGMLPLRAYYLNFFEIYGNF